LLVFVTYKIDYEAAIGESSVWRVEKSDSVGRRSLSERRRETAGVGIGVSEVENGSEIGFSSTNRITLH